MRRISTYSTSSVFEFEVRFFEWISSYSSRWFFNVSHVYIDFECVEPSVLFHISQTQKSCVSMSIVVRLSFVKHAFCCKMVSRIDFLDQSCDGCGSYIERFGGQICNFCWSVCGDEDVCGSSQIFDIPPSERR